MRKLSAILPISDELLHDRPVLRGCWVHTFVSRSCDECQAMLQLEYALFGETFMIRLPRLNRYVMLTRRQVFGW